MSFGRIKFPLRGYIMIFETSIQYQFKTIQVSLKKPTKSKKDQSSNPVKKRNISLRKTN